MRLLFVEASPRGIESISTRMAETFVDMLRAQRPGLLVDRLRLWNEALPEFDGAALDAKYARLARKALNRSQELAWAGLNELVARLDGADALLLATPMWNFGIPYRLKHWFDLITQPGLSFSFDPRTGYRPLLQDRPVTVVLASSGDYSSGPSWGRPDLASEYLRQALGFIGLRKVSIVRVGPTAGDEIDRQRAIDSATADLRTLAVQLCGAS